MRIYNRFVKSLPALMAIFLLSGCAETQLATHWAKEINWPGQETSQGTYKIGNPYRVGNVWYYPHQDFHLVETGIASWYGPNFNEYHTANGEVFDQNQLTAAHRTLQLPCLARVTNLENGRSIVVRINDRGPFDHGRILDVSRRAAELLGFIREGTARIRLQVLPKESEMLAEDARRGEDTTRMTVADLDQQIANRTGQPYQDVAAAASPPAQPDKIASASQINYAGSSSLPESLRTPEITVEDLTSAGAHTTVPTGREFGANVPYEARPSKAHAGHKASEPLVTQVPVHPTGLFVQAGSFSVFTNAESLTRKLTKIAPATIEPVFVSGRKFYRVKLGPIATVAEADRILEKVIRSTGGGAKVIRN
ncbi:MAG: septal ring lytic transglycosylase RlpA family protein [Alphaproteobacteria bacterium]|nr:septal ring lytic transglycosylase RlpA family protein [Alphaproteobacteria bacterium]MDE2336978.1 septal ring lytic transglycosylase RlpA family protein [Alphaproteobacteria bacterium]